MKKILGFFMKGVIPLFFVLWCLYFTGKSIYEYIYYRRLLSSLERELLYIRAKIAVRESRIAFLRTEQGKKIFIRKMHEEIEHQ